MELTFTDCPSPAVRIVGEEGDGLKVALRALDHTRITIASRAVGVDQGALDYAIGYLKERKQFGQRIVEFQGIQFIFAAKVFASDAAMEITTDAVRLLGGAEYVVDHPVERICEGTDQVQRLVMGRSLLS
ncbi:alkylation response protein AidB-like acyl-CoA dehydrogenase [Brevibacterium marinum]|uniref:Alkylation response protein AidB-like acyl-CoA dehydrogenase n=1 Tax=Brevibacterium marinum TaxID=418643 RepID=A0A846RXL0_9MICO|nr:acyl-CoA dehydrogenase family protein [Brevibacterium marinum]NJC55383.1 alkylation response protein AidB-like acyl-CoA dehydrogenase [Brevibacterium marinum]